MSQFKLSVATRANLAELLPVILIATSINEARPSPVIDINYEDTALITEGDKAVLKLVSASKAFFGTGDAIKELFTHFPYLVGKDTKIVSYSFV